MNQKASQFSIKNLRPVEKSQTSVYTFFFNWKRKESMTEKNNQKTRPRVSKYHRLTRNNRIIIETLYKEGYGQTSIAQRIGVHKSTISREIRRNKGQKGYRYEQAQQKADRRMIKSASIGVLRERRSRGFWTVSWDSISKSFLRWRTSPRRSAPPLRGRLHSPSQKKELPQISLKQNDYWERNWILIELYWPKKKVPSVLIVQRVLHRLMITADIWSGIITKE